MLEPQLHYLDCHQEKNSTRRMAYWEWNETGNAHHTHVIICVHGLTRQGRDFDALARDLCSHARVICPDIAGRGYSDWLADPMHYAVPQYALDMVALLARLQQESRSAGQDLAFVDWVGTSMGGLIGMVLAGGAGNAQLPLAVPIRRLLLNDVGPRLEWSALERIAAYTGLDPRFETEQEAADWLRQVSVGFGEHTQEEWLALSRPMLRTVDDESGESGFNGFKLHYDPKIALPLRQLTREQADQGEQIMWALYDAIGADTLLLRGAESDLITEQSAEEMRQRGPQARCITLEGVGHAPTLVSGHQRHLVRQFLL